MRMFSGVPEVFLYRDFVDFRKSINGLSLIVEQQMGLSPLTGSVFVFCNKGRDKLNDTSLNLTEQQLHWLFDGFDVLEHQAVYYKSVAL